jgi:hypothetical protein
MGTKKLLGLAAILEGATGLVLMIHPVLVAQLLFGDGVSGVGKVLSRIAGIALFALGVACWPDREAGNASTRSTGAMLTYSLLVTIYLVYLGVVAHLGGILLWPAVVLHAVWLFLVLAAWRHERQSLRGVTP